MSVLGIDQKLRRSFNKLKQNGNERDNNSNCETTDTGIYLQTFLHHWNSCHHTFLNYEPDSSQVQDDIINVCAQLEQMIELVKFESSGCASKSILDYILSENVLGELSAWTKSLKPNLAGPLLNLQVSLFNYFLQNKEDGAQLLSHQTILRPMISVMEQCNPEYTNFSHESVLGLIHSLSVIIMDNPEYIQLFLSPHDKKLILISMLTPYLHKPGNIGQRAKESILIFITMSSKNKLVEGIIEESNFCVILATGLSGLFSSLPSKLEIVDPTWYKLDMSDAQKIPELYTMMSSLELCSAVIEVSPPSISWKLLDLIDSGFLNPILGPALASQTEQEAVAYTSYLNLFLTEISADTLSALIIRFLLTAEVDGRPLKDIIVSRINCSSLLSTVTLNLLESLLSYNIEDVMFSLIFQHLVPCHHLAPGARDKLDQPDLQCRAAHKFLSLAPVCCDPPVTPLTPRRGPLTSPRGGAGLAPLSLELDGAASNCTNYDEYLREARQLIRNTILDCIHWRNQYDGTTPYRLYSRGGRKQVVRNQTSSGLRLDKQCFQLERDPREESIEAACEGSFGASSMSGESSGYLSGTWEQEPEEVTLSPEEEKEFWTAVGGAEARARLKSHLARIQHEDRLSLSSLGEEAHEELSPRPSHHEDSLGGGGAGGHSSSGPHSLGISVTSAAPCNIGPLLTSLLECVQNMDRNTLTLNLRLTAVVSKLASYPQPLLRSILTHPDPILQPSCPSLVQAICTVRSRIDASMPTLTGAEDAVRMARQALSSRISPERRPTSSAVNALSSLPATLGEYSRRGSKLFGILGGRKSTGNSPKSGNSIQINTHRMAMAAVLLEEWIQELAAIAHAHSLLEQQAAILK